MPPPGGVTIGVVVAGTEGTAGEEIVVVVVPGVFEVPSKSVPTPAFTPKFTLPKLTDAFV